MEELARSFKCNDLVGTEEKIEEPEQEPILPISQNIGIINYIIPEVNEDEGSEHE